MDSEYYTEVKATGLMLFDVSIYTSEKLPLYSIDYLVVDEKELVELMDDYCKEDGEKYTYLARSVKKFVALNELIEKEDNELTAIFLEFENEGRHDGDDELFPVEKISKKAWAKLDAELCKK